MQYTYDSEAKRVTDPLGQVLGVGEVIDHLNKMYVALGNTMLAWRYVSEAGGILDEVFFGATVQSDPVEDVELVDGEVEEPDV
jgi:hypothetical protein